MRGHDGISLAEMLASLGLPADRIATMTTAQALAEVRRLTPDPYPPRPTATQPQPERPQLRLAKPLKRS